MNSILGVLRKIGGVFFVSDEQVRQLPDADDPCPRCGEGSLKEDSGLVVTIHRCTNCRFEGARR